MGGSKYSVLIVDDQDNWRGLLEEVLEKEFDVVSARNYADASAEISKTAQPFHVVVTDLRLRDDTPGNEGGLELIEYLKIKAGETRTIVITGYPTIASMQKAVFGLHVDYYFEKVPADGRGFNWSAFLEIVGSSAKVAEECRNRLVFMLMPFADEYKDFYEGAIKKAMEDLGMECKRVDDFYQSRNIMGDIVSGIKNAKFILADLSGRNPNVFLEVGISHALEKHVLLLSQNLEDVPPKLQTIRFHIYKDTIEGGDKIQATLKRAVQESERANFPRFFKEHEFKMMPKTGIALVPNDTNGERTYNSLIASAMAEAQCTVEKASEIFDTNSVLDEIWAHVNTSEIVIADLSDRDPDVFYLAGLAYGLKKKIIFIARTGTDIPFDLRAGSHLVYSLDNFAAGNKARRALANLIKDALNRNS
jgi:ActR/RegA family two-component response regulator